MPTSHESQGLKQQDNSRIQILHQNENNFIVDESSERDGPGEEEQRTSSAMPSVHERINAFWT